MPAAEANVRGLNSGRVADSDRRSARRMPVRRTLDVTMLTPDGTPAHRVVVRVMDVSTTGMGVVSRGPLRAGMRGITPMERSDGRTALVGVEVVHAHVAGDGVDSYGYAAGLRFFRAPEAVAKRVRVRTMSA